MERLMRTSIGKTAWSTLNRHCCGWNKKE